MRTWAVCSAAFGGSTKVVSARLNSAAIRCICSLDRPSAATTTASGLPPNCVSVKTSTVTKCNRMGFIYSWAGGRLVEDYRYQIDWVDRYGLVYSLRSLKIL